VRLTQSPCDSRATRTDPLPPAQTPQALCRLRPLCASPPRPAAGPREPQPVRASRSRSARAAAGPREPQPVRASRSRANHRQRPDSPRAEAAMRADSVQARADPCRLAGDPHRPTTAGTDPLPPAQTNRRARGRGRQISPGIPFYLVPSSWANFGLDVLLELHGPRRGAALEDALRDAVRGGRLTEGTTLPSSRALAAELGLARNTVAEAYGQLVAEGWLTARQGSGTRVAGKARPVRDPGRPGRPLRCKARASICPPGCPTCPASPGSPG